MAPKPFTVRRYTADDYPLINGWWQDRHGGCEDFPWNKVPPLGVIVEDESGPICALWCYECFGVDVAFIEWPVARPGLQLPALLAAFAHAVSAITVLAGKCCEPPASYTVFRAMANPLLFRVMQLIGFARENPDGETKIPVILHL